MNFVASGEPLPPGFEDEMSRTAVITKAIESHKGGALIGTEYAVELHGGGQVRPDYFCVLCNTCNDSRSIFIHWTSVPHRTNYLKTHFQKAFELLQQLRRASGNSNELLVNGTNKLVQNIEKHFGRSTQIMVAASDDFRRSRAKICSQVRDKFHYDECAGPDFVDEVRQMLADSKPTESNKSSPNVSKSTAADSSTITLDAISSDDDDSFSTATGQQKQTTPPNKKARKKQEEQQPAYRAINRSPPGPGADKTTKPAVSAGVKQQLPTPKELSMQASQIAQERYRWEKFRCLLEIQLKLLRDETETYESNPEKHPDYSEEWKLFWNRRYKQLQEEKKCDPNSYDYKPEWISYWKDRRVELFNIAVAKIKKELKEKFKLGDEDEENTKELMERYKIRISSPKNASDSAAGASSVSSSTNAAGNRRKPNYRGSNHRAGNGGGGAEAVIDISDDEHDQAPAAPSARPSRRPPYGRSISRSLSPKRGRREVSSRLGRRSRSRSPLGGRRRLHTRSRSRSSHRRSSRSPYSRVRDRSHHSRGHDDYLDRDREKERARERSSGDYYRDRGESYTRSSRAYEPMETFRVLDPRSYPEYSQPGVKRSSSPTSTSAVAASKEVEHNEEPEGPLTVVSVLRMLSALEDQLGSLGPKALNLLSKALAMEKVKPNAAEDLLLNEDNCVFLETTKEKLKGILIAEVLEDPQKVRVVKKLITNIATIIFQASTKDTEKSAPTEPKLNELTKKEYQLPYDRQIVSSKLASALIKNGVDNVNTEDMNRLMHFFTLLAKTHHQRRQTDRTSGLNFAEVPIRMGLEQPKVTNDDSTNSSAGNPDINIDLAELIKEVESQLAAKETSNSSGTAAAKAASNASDTSSHGMESLTDSDLQTLLQNFKFLSNEEQVHLIGHLRKLEKLDPQRVEQLRKYVKIAEISSDGELCSDYLSRVVAINRPGGNNNSERAERTSGTAANTRVGSASVSNATGATGSAMRRMSPERDRSSPAKLQRRAAVRSSPNFMLDDDDDDDYNFDDLVMKANDSNGKKSVMMGGGNNNNNNAMPAQTANKTTANPLTFKPAASKISLKDTENIIASLMGTLTSNSNQATSAAAKAQAQKQQLQQQQQHPHPQLHPQQQQQQHPQQRNLSSLMQNRQSQPQQQQQQGGFVPNNGGNNYYNYGNDQMSSSGPSGYLGGPPQQQQQQQQQQPPFNMGNYNAYGPPMGPVGGPGPGPGGYVGPMNPWANGPQQPYNNNPQNYMAPQQQQQQQQSQQYNNNMYGGAHQ